MPSPSALRAAVKSKYRRAARRISGLFPYETGRRGALARGYDPAWLRAVPHAALARFAGVGTPFALCGPRPGDRVLDAGCGAGTDVFVAARMCGSAAGVDLTPAMLAVARRAARGWKGGRVEFRAASVERLPFPDASFDLVLSNGALNLVPDKDAAFREIHRVLRPGGRFVAADLLVVASIPRRVLADMDAWST
ncbi:MAG: methyltransferase domain-containing protein [Planctomycetia bacterium]|nr:methyltransferase domain-containing protein [Planctomycetia bacterium]